MNQITAKISSIHEIDNICQVHFDIDGTILTMISLSLEGSMQVESKIILGVKATSVMLATHLEGMISTSNQLKCTVIEVDNGAVLSRIILDYKGQTLESIITVDSSKRMNIEIGNTVIALFKASELSILEHVA